ncbi:MAG: hypothetical protein EOR73_28560 [Mesorhizobium sp.]|nr:MAG: hypothetical protein EOR73_28560 [Mesorhizobium sp.]
MSESGGAGGSGWPGLGAAIIELVRFVERIASPFIPDVLKKRSSRPTITENPRNSRPWHLAKQNDGTYLLQLMNEWLVTNNSDAPLILVSVDINRPKVREAIFMVEGPEGWGNFGIPPRQTLRLHTDFMVPTRKFQWRGSKWFDFTFTDHTGHQTHKRHIEVKEERQRTAKTTKLPGEAVVNLTDDRQRAVVSLLQDELVRYSRNGREKGGLGTILAVEGQKKITTNIYQDGWTSIRAAERQDITVGRDTKIVSEIGDKLVDYEAHLPADGASVVQEYLLDRIDRDREYYGVTYITVYALWRMDRLKDALETVFARYEYKPTFADKIFRRSYANRVLAKEQRYGYSDVLGLLNGILRYEHESLSEDDLNSIEKLARTTGEHAFQIPQKVASVRAYRVGSERKQG